MLTEILSPTIAYLSHKMKSLSFMVGTVCCGFIWRENILCKYHWHLVG